MNQTTRLGAQPSLDRSQTASAPHAQPTIVELLMATDKRLARLQVGSEHPGAVALFRNRVIRDLIRHHPSVRVVGGCRDNRLQ